MELKLKPQTYGIGVALELIGAIWSMFVLSLYEVPLGLLVAVGCTWLVFGVATILKALTLE